MRGIRIAAAALTLFLPAPSFGQEWIEYVDCAERFSVNFPAKPDVQATTYLRYNLDADGNRIGRVSYEPLRCQ